jgi:hypothetical protein
VLLDVGMVVVTVLATRAGIANDMRIAAVSIFFDARPFRTYSNQLTIASHIFLSKRRRPWSPFQSMEK